MKPMRSVLCLVVLLTMTLSACALEMPADPRGTLDHVSGGVLRVGATENFPWVEVPDGTAGEVVPKGSEAELIESFATSLNADITWMTGSESSLMAALERGELDIVIGGFDDQTVWAEQAAVTVPFTETAGPWPSPIVERIQRATGQLGSGVEPEHRATAR